MELNTTQGREEPLQQTPIHNTTPSSNSQQNGEDLIKYNQLQQMVQQLYMAQGQVPTTALSTFILLF